MTITRFSADDIRAIRRDRRGRMAYKDIARKWGCSPSVAWAICNAIYIQLNPKYPDGKAKSYLLPEDLDTIDDLKKKGAKNR